MEKQAQTQYPLSEEASFGGAHFRLEYENEEKQKHHRSARMWENIVVGIGFGTIALMVMMVLISISTSLL